MNEGTQNPSAIADELQASPRHIIKRPRLTKLLDEADARVILLVAPAGYGKTTLAREWLGQRNRTALWLQARHMHDLRGVIRELLNLLEHASLGTGHKLGQRLEADRAPDPPAEALAELLIRDLPEWPTNLWLIIDDYHMLSHVAGADVFFGRVARSRIQLVVVGRTRPEWVKPRDLLYGDVFEVGRASLAMTIDEARTVATDQSRETLHGLFDLAEGWPAIIGLAALTPSPSSGLDRVLPEGLYEFLADEVFNLTGESLRTDLCYLAIPPKLDERLIRGFLGDRAEATLREARRVGFASTLDDGTVEIHPLFRSFLKQRLARDQAPPQEVLEAVCQCLIGDDRWDEAFSVIDDYGLGTQLIGLLEAALPTALSDARFSTIGRWVDFARARRLDHPYVDLADAEVLFARGELQLSETLAMAALAHLDAPSWFVTEAHNCAGRAAQFMGQARRAYEHYDHAYATTSDALERQRCLWGQFSASVYVDELDPEAILNKYALAATSSPTEEVRLHQARLIINNTRDGGLLHDALAAAEPAIRLLPRATDPLVSTGFLNQFANDLSLIGCYELAGRYAREELDYAETLQLTFVRPHALLNLAVAQMGLGLYAKCSATLDAVDRERKTVEDDHLTLNAVATRGRLHISTAAHERAIEVMAIDLVRDPPPFIYSEFLATQALARACVNDTTTSLQLARQALEMPSNIDTRVLAACVQSITALGTDTEDSALLALVSTVEETGNVDGLLCAVRGHPPLVEALVESSITEARLRRIVGRRGSGALAIALGVGPATITGRRAKSGELLSRREREVLELVTLGMRNQEIASQLFISQKTVKTHLQNIYAKLDVRSRTEAAMWAANADQPTAPTSTRASPSGAGD